MAKSRDPACMRMDDNEIGDTRWDAVSNGQSVWSDATDPSVPLTETPTEVRVWLFGSFAADDVRRPIVLRVAPGATAGSVLAELGRNLGSARFAEVANSSGEKRSICRLFVDGKEVEDLSSPLSGNSGCSDLEMIVLAGIEGG